MFAVAVCCAQPCEAQTPPEITTDEIIELNLPEQIELRLLVDLVCDQLGIRAMYSEDAVRSTVTIKGAHRLPKSSLLELLDRALRIRGLLLVDGDPPGWYRIVQGSGVDQPGAAHYSRST